MKQYSFVIVEKSTGWRASVRCTARTENGARKQIVGYYGDNFTIADWPEAIRPAHYVLGEIDASDC